MDTKAITYLATNTLLVVVIERIFSLLQSCPGFPTGGDHQPKGSEGAPTYYSVENWAEMSKIFLRRSACATSG